MEQVRHVRTLILVVAIGVRVAGREVVPAPHTLAGGNLGCHGSLRHQHAARAQGLPGIQRLVAADYVLVQHHRTPA